MRALAWLTVFASSLLLATNANAVEPTRAQRSHKAVRAAEKAYPLLNSGKPGAEITLGNTVVTPAIIRDSAFPSMGVSTHNLLDVSTKNKNGSVTKIRVGIDPLTGKAFGLGDTQVTYKRAKGGETFVFYGSSGSGPRGYYDTARINRSRPGRR
jgi:hypothetical protein